MAIRTYKLSLLKVSLFILLLSSYRLGTLADDDVNRSPLDPDPGKEEQASHLERQQHQLGGDRVPRVLLGILARNVAHMLPNFFGCVDNLDYPKESITIW